LSLGITACLTSCSTEPVTDVSGTWTWTEAFTAAGGLSCQATGELLLAHFSDKKRFSGQRSRMGTCTGAPTGFTIDGGQNLIGAEVSGSDVSFDIDFCQYTGTLTSTAMSGSMVCPDGLGDVKERIDGTWSAGR